MKEVTVPLEDVLVRRAHAINNLNTRGRPYYAVVPTAKDRITRITSHAIVLGHSSHAIAASKETLSNIQKGGFTVELVTVFPKPPRQKRAA